ncbi:MAG: threonine/serine exporter family protein [Cellulosilyticaceae bacterium]
MWYLCMNIISAFVTTVCFSLLFNVSKKHIWICGFVGSIGWGLYTLGELMQYSTVLSTFVASLVISQISYFLAKSRRAPVTVFLIPGIIPLVPGVGLYRTMYSLLFADYTKALEYALVTFQLSGVIAGSIIIAALLPLLFRTSRQKKWPRS